MIAMSQTITVKGAVKFSMKKLITGAEMATSNYTGPGEILLAPPFLGDITSIRLSGTEKWRVGKDAFLAATVGVVKDTKRQDMGKAIFSGEGLFTYNISGRGIAWISSFGAIVRKDVRQFSCYLRYTLLDAEHADMQQLHDHEQYFVDNGHLVAWNCDFEMIRAASGGLISGITSGEGLVCRFTGPGTVFLQTRNPQMFTAWIGAHAA